MANYDLKIEQQILATILYDYAKFERFDKLLTAETFYFKANQDIYKAIKQLYKNDLPIDEEYIKNILDKEDKFNASILIQILSSNALANADQYIRDMQKKHIDREATTLTTKFKGGELTIEQLQTKLSKLQSLYQEEKTTTHTKTDIDLKRFSPFIRDVVSELHKINNHPINMILSTVLTSMGGLIGARAKIEQGPVKVYPVIWSIIIAPSSIATKSTLTGFTIDCIFGNLQNDLFEEYKGKLEKYKEEKKAYNNLTKDEKRNEIEPDKPEPQLLIFQNDGTPEAKLKSLEENQNGGVIYYDEMRSELEKSNNDNAYKALKTSIFDGKRYHKKLVNGGSIILDHPVICENGLITEQWLLESIRKNDIVSGFMARFVFCYCTKDDFKPLSMKNYKPINTFQFAKVGDFIINLLGLEREEPLEFILEYEAKEYYNEWFDEYSENAYYTETDEEITASYRLATYALKFALVSYIFNCAYEEIDFIKEGRLAIPLKYIKEAIYIMNIFRNENDKVLDLFSKNNKLHKKLDDVSTKLLNKIRATKEKKLSRTKATNSIRGLTAQKLDEFIERGIFIQTDGKTKYIMES